MRKVIDFNHGWKFAKQKNIPKKFPDEWKDINLPHTWNALDGQDGGNDYWRGTAMYCKKFPMPETERGGKVFLEFPAAAMVADVYMNGKYLAHHEGGFSTFRVDITDMLCEDNLVCVAVDNSENGRVYPQKADFTFYGGLYRGAKMILVPEKHFELEKNGTPGIKITPVVHGKNAEVKVETWQNGPGTVSIKVAGNTVNADSTDGYASAKFEIRDVRLWDGIDDPYLYTATAEFGGDRISARFGCRTIEVSPEKGFILNGRVYPLRGVSRHQDRKDMGNALTMKEHREDFEMIREIGANSVRLAHYQHAQEFYDLCDEYGLIVWAEIPYITKHMEDGQNNTFSQMTELITQCYNHPSIVCWGLSNEITAAGKISESLIENHRKLNSICHRMDHTRPTVMAHAFMLEPDSKLIGEADLAAYNLYFGWYLGNLEQNDRFFDEYHSRFPNRPIALSEYGADANTQFQSSSPEQGDYSETYQCVYHEHILSCIEQRPYLWATYVWNMFDFAADGRDEGGKHGENQKGLVTFDRKIKKDAFFLYKAAWSRKPFIHLCGKRYVNRAETETEIKVYSNLEEITLLVDGKKLETTKSSRIFTFHVPVTGRHLIEAKGENQSDRMIIQRVSKPNPSYFFRRETVINWFDREAMDSTCYSIQDTMGELKQNPVSYSFVEKIMAKVRASRGDVAREAGVNENLEKMLAGIPFEKLLRQARNALSTEEIRNLNEQLQKIKKQKM